MSTNYTKVKPEQVNLIQLQAEINATGGIVPSCTAATTEESDLILTFAAELSSSEETILDGIIASHTPNPEMISVSELPISTDTNKLAVQHSAKPLIPNKTTYVVWTGAGDNLETHQLSDGPILAAHLEPGTAEESIDVKFDPIHGRVWLNEGYLRFQDAGVGDYVSAYIIAPASQLQTMANLNLVVDANNYIKFAPGGPGTGTHGFAATPVLLPRTYSRDGDWDYDGTNLLPNMTGTGEYKMSTEEKPVHKYFNKIPLFGTCPNYFSMASDDTAELIYPYFVRIIFHNISNTTWSAQVIMEIYRERTCEP